MAKTLIVPKSKLFLIVMTDEDMKYLTCICEVKRKNYHQVVEACFHAGLVTLTQSTKCHCSERKPHAKIKEKDQEICTECGYRHNKRYRENEPTGDKL